MDFYNLDYIYAEAQFTAGLQVNLQQIFYFTRQPVGAKETSVKSTYFCRIVVTGETPDHLASQRVIDEGIAHFTRMLGSDSVYDIKFTRIDVLKSLGPTGNNESTFALVVDYLTPAKKTIKTIQY